MFKYGEPLSKKSNLEREVLAYLDEQFKRLEGSTINPDSGNYFIRKLMGNDSIDGRITPPFYRLHPQDIGLADPWVYYHYKDLAEFDFQLGYQYKQLVRTPEFALEWYNPIANPCNYEFFVYEQTLACLLSAPEFEFLFDDEKGLLEVTPDVISKIHSLREEYPTKIEQLLKSPLLEDRLAAEKVCDFWEYPLNPEMSALDRLGVLLMGHHERRYAVGYELDKLCDPIIMQSLNLPLSFKITKDLLSTVLIDKSDPLRAYDSLAAAALEDPLLLEAIKAFPKEDIKRLVFYNPQPQEALYDRLSEYILTHSSNSLSDLAQEARSASKALSNSERNTDVKDREER